jgi:hypothetical protein
MPTVPYYYDYQSRLCRLVPVPDPDEAARLCGYGVHYAFNPKRRLCWLVPLGEEAPDVAWAGLDPVQEEEEEKVPHVGWAGLEDERFVEVWTDCSTWMTQIPMESWKAFNRENWAKIVHYDWTPIAGFLAGYFRPRRAALAYAMIYDMLHERVCCEGPNTGRLQGWLRQASRIADMTEVVTK